MRQLSPKPHGRLTMILILFLFVFNLACYAQQEKIAFEKYGVEEGLPEEFVASMVQDDQGFIWATTQNGLIKFDGYKIKVFRGDRQDPDGIWSRNLGSGLIKAKDGKLWIGSGSNSGGLTSFNPRTDKFTNFFPDFKDSSKVPYSNCSVLLEDIENNIWFRSFSGNRGENMLCRYEPNTKKIYRYPYEVGSRFNDIVLNFSMAESKKDSSIWLVTADKIVMRYVRKADKFEQILKKGDVIPGTSINDSIQDITPTGPSGLIPMGNNQHLYLWDPITRKAVHQYSFPEHTDGQWIGAVFEDQKGYFWVSSVGQLTRIHPEKLERQDYKVGEGILNFKGGPTDITSIIPVLHDDSFVWFLIGANDSPNSSILRYDHRKKSFEWFDGKLNYEKNQLEIWVRLNMLKDRTGLLWLGNRPSLYKQSPKAKQLELFRHDPKDLASIPSDTISFLFEDSRQRLWVGTESGLSLKLDENKFQRFNYKNDKNKISFLEFISKIYEDSKGQIWVISGNILYRISQNQQSFERVKSVKNNDPVLDILEGNNGNMWVSVLNKGLYIIDLHSTKLLKKYESTNTDVHGLESSILYGFYLDSRGNMWIGDPRDNDLGLFKYIETENRFKHYHYQAADTLSLGNNEISFMAEDDLGRMWVGTDGGISLYDHEKDIFYRNNDDLNLPSVHAYSKGSDGKMWFWAYSGGGLSLVGPDISSINMFGEEKGLLHNDMAVSDQLSKDDRGQLWLPNQRGLSVFDTNTQSFKNYFKKDGFQDYSRDYVTQIAADGDIWIGGDHGLNRIDPDKLLQKDSIAPAVLITSMGIMDSIYESPDGNIFKEAVSFTKEIKLQYWQKDLSFDFVALHYLRSEDNMYSWKLENYDKKWSEPSKERHVSYTNLSPGKYTFQVKGSNADGIWNEQGASMEIVIAPPWWMTNLAYAVYALLVILIGFQVHKYQRAKTLRLAREKSQKKELEQAKEIEKAYTELKGTQAQLIQSEKMASLGELTAGIAHEIQNPLNFVNNFSEVNAELIEEMNEELEKGNLDEVKSIAKDIVENEKKIIQHGKRADDIVKGMLQHSRKSSGQKEPTNINDLMDEFIRLAYHGLRAKDKSFNASFETDFDNSIGEVNIVAQDIGRVILNLINNAFYAVNDRKKKEPEGYEPSVIVGTKKLGDHLELKISDNGLGIPSEIKDKIFQPFFTSKPTGEGTGLGLSLSYDIIKAHGGEIQVKSKENEGMSDGTYGTEFTIVLPI